jgi:hypothetical protein
MFPGHRDNRRICGSTVIRWIGRGLPAPGGRIFLQAERIGGRWLTRHEWINEFKQRLTTAHLPAEAQSQ